jgi:hypothetical protein
MSCKAELEDQEWYRFHSAENIIPGAPSVKHESYFGGRTSSFLLAPSDQFQALLYSPLAVVVEVEFLFAAGYAAREKSQKTC